MPGGLGDVAPRRCASCGSTGESCRAYHLAPAGRVLGCPAESDATAASRRLRLSEIAETALDRNQIVILVLGLRHRW